MRSRSESDRTRRWPGTLALTFLVAASVVVASGSAYSKYDFLFAWQSVYPNSQSDDNAQGAGASCILCHQKTTGGSPWNGYGWKVREYLNAGKTTTEAITLADAFDSDLDPTGSVNGIEIGADTQPGWTPGANNTLYKANGQTISNQTPPAGILGNLDPPPTGSWVDLGNGLAGAGGTPLLSGTGTLQPSTPVTLSLTNALPGSFAWLIIGLTAANAPFYGGTLVPSADVIIPSLPTSGAGSLLLGTLWPASLPSGTSFFFQYWIVDPSGPQGASASNGLQAITP